MTDDPTAPAETTLESASPSARAPVLEPAAILPTPYRLPPDGASPFAPLRRPSLVGAGVFVFGVLLWAFVVMGELTTSYGPGRRSMLVGEAFAFVVVLGATVAAFRAALRRNLDVQPPASPLVTYVRGAFIAGFALVLCFVVVECAIAFGKTSSHGLDGPITLMLLIVAVAAALGGRRLAGLNRPPNAGRERLLARLLWAVSILVTFVALVLVVGS